ncbi:TWO-COMPONENT RESPONSE REGULATOR [Salix koriyanagi]|uniref:TWO-COMPONENT RESPONSE REGULATOR n=1 Tax=Salix koriyanagi TaxID=2511006 RepID=A0A9Q0WCA0_9ROSI|nr:TWO-COMPONENT RESPONSE REGULATOR [Salix koriyanagi]
MEEVVISSGDELEVKERSEREEEKQRKQKEETGEVKKKKKNKKEGEGLNGIVRWEGFLPRMVLRVLLVEADDSTRQIIAALLKKCSYRVAGFFL